MRDRKITIMQVFHAMGITPTRDQSWAVGNRMQRAYANEFGEQPPKDNRPKTNGGGSHCFALYPPGWRARIEEAVRAVVAAERSQTDLFDQQ